MVFSVSEFFTRKRNQLESKFCCRILKWIHQNVSLPNKYCDSDSEEQNLTNVMATEIDELVVTEYILVASSEDPSIEMNGGTEKFPKSETS